jgi:hypothetical protein
MTININNTGGKFATVTAGVVGTGGKFATGSISVNETTVGKLPPVSMTPVAVNDTSGK